MSRKQTRLFWSMLVIIAFVVSLYAFASTRRIPALLATEARENVRQDPRSSTANRPSHVRRGILEPQLPWKLNALGDRLEKPGKERVSLTGTLSRRGDPQPSAFTGILEFPDRLRFTLVDGAQTRIITFNGEEAKASGTIPNSDERDLIETLVYDTAEHFFSTQMEGQATRFLGGRFRVDDGSSANYSGPYYDIYQVSEQIKASANGRRQTKHYYFNSDTLLLERVCYQIDRGGSAVKVETLIRDWQRAQGQQIPRRIERIENGTAVFVVTINSVILSPRVEDGIFGSSSGN